MITGRLSGGIRTFRISPFFVDASSESSINGGGKLTFPGGILLDNDLPEAPSAEDSAGWRKSSNYLKNKTVHLKIVYHL